MYQWSQSQAKLEFWSTLSYCLLLYLFAYSIHRLNKSMWSNLLLFTSSPSLMTFAPLNFISPVGVGAKNFACFAFSFPMYNGVGVLTPRGTGTNGHVMTNLSRPRGLTKKNQISDWNASQPKVALPKANFDLLEHGVFPCVVQ